jgi:hypothetical protein
MWGWVVNATPRPLCPRERPGTHCIGGWGGGQDRFGTGAENLAPPPTGIRSSDRRASSESPYQLSYPRPRFFSEYEYQ